MNKLKYMCLIILLNSYSVMSADTPNMKLFGTLLVPPPCVISNNELIDVYFGHNVGIHKVDGINYTESVNYQLVCDPNLKVGIWDFLLLVPRHNLTRLHYKPIFPI